MQVGSYIKSRRENIGMSKSKLAREIGVNRSQVIRWELEQTEPTLSNFIKVCDVLGINVNDFIKKKQIIRSYDAVDKDGNVIGRFNVITLEKEPTHD